MNEHLPQKKQQNNMDYVEELSFSPHSKDFFSCLELPIKFPIEKTSLVEAYITKLALVHPDNFNLHSFSIKQAANEHSAYLNEAYSTLNDEIKLLAYSYKLFTHEPIPSPNSSNLAGYFFGWHERIEEATEAKDSTKLANIKLQLNNEFKLILMDAYALLNKASASLNGPDTAKVYLAPLPEKVAKLNFIKKLLQQ